mmetsp:Transcript_40807/g.29446  ORF Transcript_40807/g.29446 Transcript_40807/m.29446 type:complete len:304 (+) Transcript_40807:749-1660(+)
MCAGGKVEDHENGPDLVQALLDNDVITENTFSFFIADEAEDSYVDFGPARDSGMSNPDDIVYLTLDDHFFWLGEFVAVSFGGEEEHSFRFPEPYPVVYDTGSSLSLVPVSIAKAFFQELVGDMDVVMYGGVLLVNCDLEGWPNVYVMTQDNYWLEYSPHDYIVPVPDMPEGYGEGVCFIGFMAFDDLDFWLAGNDLLRGYYSVHKRSNFELGLVPNTVSSKHAVMAGELPIEVLKERFTPASFINNMMVLAFSYIFWWVMINHKVADLPNASYQSSSINALKKNKEESVEDEDELRSTIQKLQ